MLESPAQYTLRSTRVLLPSGLTAADVRIDRGRIASVSPAAGAPDPAVHDVGDLVVMPGIVDTHVHVNEPGRAEWEGFATAGAAAAAGGVTTIVDMPLNCVPPTTTARALELKRRAAQGAIVNVEFWGGVVPGNAPDLEALADAGVRGFKCFLAPSGVAEFERVEEPDLRAALPILARRRLPLLAHAEWPPSLLPVPADADPAAYPTWLDSRPPAAECDAIVRLVRLCAQFGARLHVVHVAAAAAVPLLREARASGLAVSAETCPHYLTFCADEIPRGGTGFKCAPPIRDRATRAALWDALVDGTLDLIATDHSPSPPSLKAGGDFIASWGGIASLELGLGAVWAGAAPRGIGIDRVSRWLSAAPASLAGLDSKGAIVPGMDADFCVWDPDVEWVVDQERLAQRHKSTPYHGRTLRGRVRETYVGGRLVYRGR